MTVLLIFAGFALLIVPGAIAPHARTLHPSEWARMNRTALSLGLAAVNVGLVLAMTPTALRSARLHVAADTCHRVFGIAALDNAATGLIAAATTTLMLGACIRSWRRATRLQREARIDGDVGTHHDVDGATLVELPTERVVAYAAPGSPPQIVLSEGLLQRLPTDERDVVVEHELAHLRHRHHRHLRVALMIDTVLGWVPGVRASTEALRLSVERWADEEAATPPRTRSSVRDAILTATEAMIEPVPAFTTACTVAERLDALAMGPAAPGTARRVLTHAPLASLAVFVLLIAACLMTWGPHPHLALLAW